MMARPARRAFTRDGLKNKNKTNGLRANAYILLTTGYGKTLVKITHSVV
jgi:hypothetical protein